MILTNANIFTRGCSFVMGSVFIEDGKIQKLKFGEVKLDNKKDVIDCHENYLMPGFIDIHFHGCEGYDFCEASTKALDAITNYEIKNGITSICPATMTYPEKVLTKVMQCVSNYSNCDGAEIVGVNMEGPFISAEKVGAQNLNYVQKPNYQTLKSLQQISGGKIKFVDIAPEVDGAKDFILEASKEFIISIAHTNCDYDTAITAYKNGAKHLTHTYNAMPGIHHRNPGPIIAASESGATAEIICDGQHVNYAAVRLAFKLFKNKICLISDSCEATGLNDGEYSLGGQAILKTGNKVVLKDNPNTIAASATNLFDCFKHAVIDAKINLESAVAAASLNPAKAAGIDLFYGSIEPGKFADVLLVDKNLSLLEVIKSGNVVKR